MRLEADLGVKLFERTTRQVELTVYGKIYLKYAEKINLLGQQAVDEINRRHSENEGLIIGGIPSINEYGILDLVTEFIAKMHIHCQVKTAPSEDLEEMLAKQRIDFAFVKNVQKIELFTELPYTKDHLVAVLPKNHPLADQKSVQISQLKRENFVFQPENSRPYELCIQICEAAGFTPNVIYSDRIVENILNFVKKGLGVSLLMGKLIPTDENLVVLPIEPTVTADINLCYLKNQKLNHFQNEFVTFFNDDYR